MATEFQVMKLAYDQAKQQYNKLNAERNEALKVMERRLKELKAVCSHPEEACVDKREHFGGSYYDKSSTDYWRECTICGTKSKVRTVMGYYG